MGAHIHKDQRGTSIPALAGGARPGHVPTPLPRMQTGSLADHDRLVAALAAFDAAAPGFAGVERLALAEAAALCGWAEPADLIGWAGRRVATYRSVMRRAVAELIAATAADLTDEARLERITGRD